MHVTIIDPDAPYPPTSGKRLRSLNLLLPLALGGALYGLWSARAPRSAEKWSTVVAGGAIAGESLTGVLVAALGAAGVLS